MHCTLSYRHSSQQVPYNITFFNHFVKIFFICVFFTPRASFSSFEQKPATAYFQSLAGAGSAIAGFSSHVFFNPAAIDHRQALQTSASYMHLYSLAELELTSVSLSSALHASTVAVGVQHFGSSLYRESVAALALAFPVYQGITIGLCGRYNQLAIQNYGQAAAWCLDAGLRAQLSPQLAWGICAHNLTAARIGSTPEQLPQSVQTGFSLAIVDSLFLYADIFQRVQYPADLRLGWELSRWTVLHFRFGTGLQPGRFSGGLSIFVKNMTILYGFHTHIDLPVSHQFQIMWRWK